MFDGVASLVDKSLLQQMGESAGEARFGMLGTMREYGLERLAATGEEAGTRRAHAAYMMIMAEDGAPHLANGTEQALWMERFFSEHDNIRAALGWLIQTGKRRLGFAAGSRSFSILVTARSSDRGTGLDHGAAQATWRQWPMRMWILAVATALCNLQGDFASGLEFTQRKSGDSSRAGRSLGHRRQPE